MDFIASADGHCVEPADLWTSRMPHAMRDRALRYHYFDDLVDMVGICGSRVTTNRFQRPDGSFVDADISVQRRLDDLERDGVMAELLHPNLGIHLYFPDHALAIAHARVYNDYVAETFLDCRRIVPGATIPITDVDDALEEIDRVAALGFRVIELPSMPPRPYFWEGYEPIWAAAAKRGLVVAMHASSGFMADENGQPIASGMHRPPPGEGGAQRTLRCMGIVMGMSNITAPTIAGLVCAGVTERYPNLHFILIEADACWLAGLMSSMDTAFTLGIGEPEVYLAGQYDHSRPRDEQPMLFNAFGQDKLWPYPMKPSEYIRRQIHVTFMSDPTAVAARHVTGVEPLLWGSDYPHPEATWPRSREALDRMFRDVEPAERAAMTGGTLARLVGLPTG